MNTRKINEQLNLKIEFWNEHVREKLAESFLPITKKLEKLDESTRKLGEVVKKSDSGNETPQQAMKNTRNDIQPGVIFDTVLEKTLSCMENQKGFLWNRRKS